MVVGEVPTCTKLLQVAPVQRSIRYWLIVPPVSVAAVQERLICKLDAAVAVRLVGAIGGMVDAAAGGNATLAFGGLPDLPLRLQPAHVGRAFDGAQHWIFVLRGCHFAAVYTGARRASKLV